MEYEGGSIYVEPWGGSGGIGDWSYNLKGPIKEIFIAHGEVIDSIKFSTMDTAQGTTIESPKFGGNGGSQIKVIIGGSTLEYLTGIRGTLTHYEGQVVVKSLSFITNGKNIYGPFGTESGGTPFSLTLKEGGAIVGFHGRAGSHLDAIGVYLRKFKKNDKTALSQRRGGIRARIEKIINVDGEKEMFVAIEGYFTCRMGFNVVIFKMA